MKVGVVSTGSIPYVIRDGDKYSGIAIDIWENIAKKSDIDFTYVESGKNHEEALEKLRIGDVDILVGPYNITSKRYQHVDFTIPFYKTDISLLSSHKINNLEGYLNITKVFSSIIFLFIFILFLNNFINNFNRNNNFISFFFDSIPTFKDRKLYLLYSIILAAVIIIYINTFNPSFQLNNNDFSIKNKKIIFRDEPNNIKISKSFEAKGEVIKTIQSADHTKQIQNDNLFNTYLSTPDIYGILGDSSRFSYILNHNIKKYETLQIVKKKISMLNFSFPILKKSDKLDIINQNLREAQKEKITQIIVTKYLGTGYANNASF